MGKLKPHDPKKRRLFNQCKDSPSGKHQFVTWREKENGKWVILGTHCAHCNKIGKHISGR